MLLPQYLQVLMGYTAQQSGMALSPGGLLIICLLPMVGRLVGKVDARLMIAFGFLVLSASLFYMARQIDMQMDFADGRRAPLHPVGRHGVPLRAHQHDLVRRAFRRRRTTRSAGS